VIANVTSPIRAMVRDIEAELAAARSPKDPEAPRLTNQELANQIEMSIGWTAQVLSSGKLGDLRVSTLEKLWQWSQKHKASSARA